jgi:hypothetical protein
VVGVLFGLAPAVEAPRVDVLKQRALELHPTMRIALPQPSGEILGLHLKTDTHISIRWQRIRSPIRSPMVSPLRPVAGGRLAKCVVMRVVRL